MKVGDDTMNAQQAKAQLMEVLKHVRNADEARVAWAAYHAAVANDKK